MRTTLPLSLNAPLPERFWDKVDRRGPDECWAWRGCMSSRGYGKFNVAGTIHYATRLSWADANGGSFPVGMFACHTCDNPACVNPAHIWPGTNQQNVSDAGAKRRHHMSRRDACKNGHAFTTENTLVSPTKAGGTYRRCRACGRKNAHRKG